MASKRMMSASMSRSVWSCHSFGTRDADKISWDHSQLASASPAWQVKPKKPMGNQHKTEAAIGWICTPEQQQGIRVPAMKSGQTQASLFTVYVLMFVSGQGKVQR